MYKRFLDFFLGANGGTFAGCSVGGWLISIHLLLNRMGTWSFLSWEFLFKTIIGLTISIVSGMLGVIGKEAAKDGWIEIKRWIRKKRNKH